MQLNIKATAMAFGLTWGGCLLIITWWIIFLEGSSDTTTFIGKFYLGYSLRCEMNQFLGVLNSFQVLIDSFFQLSNIVNLNILRHFLCYLYFPILHQLNLSFGALKCAE